DLEHKQCALTHRDLYHQNKEDAGSLLISSSSKQSIYLHSAILCKASIIPTSTTVKTGRPSRVCPTHTYVGIELNSRASKRDNLSTSQSTNIASTKFAN